jgi:hypothetical protein
MRWNDHERSVSAWPGEAEATAGEEIDQEIDKSRF